MLGPAWLECLDGLPRGRPELVTWRQGSCLAYGEGVTFAALSEIVKAHADILDADDVPTVEAKLKAVLPEGDDRPWLRRRRRPPAEAAAHTLTDDLTAEAFRAGGRPKPQEGDDHHRLRRQQDRAGAFADELKVWEASGNTKSVIYSHGTDNAGPTKSSRPVGPSVRRAR